MQNMILYSVNDEDFKVDKSLTAGKTVQFNVKGDFDEIEPTFDVAFDPSSYNKNYLYCSINGYYYFIRKKTIVNHRIIMSCYVDALMSLKTDLRNSSGHVVRSASNYDEYIADSMVVNKASNQIYTCKIGAGFNRSDKYLVTIGGR